MGQSDTEGSRPAEVIPWDSLQSGDILTGLKSVLSSSPGFSMFRAVFNERSNPLWSEAGLTPRQDALADLETDISSIAAGSEEWLNEPDASGEQGV
mmetsp:Transcript_46099/g.105188  ORF Transcript_46099/g.105188 Transcript_46099/m.105188 type:complete len:96 (+) Transcript_46099:98-385(+)